MRTSQALPYAVLLLLLASSSSSYASVLEDTCKSFGANYNYCMKFFQSDKHSTTADKRGLAIIATGIARAAAVSMLTRIAALKATDKDKKIQGPLTDCDAKYTGAVNAFDDPASEIAAGKLQDALTNLGYVQAVPDSCEEGFREVRAKSPLAEENSKFARTCNVPYIVTRMLYLSQPPKM